MNFLWTICFSMCLIVLIHSTTSSEDDFHHPHHHDNDDDEYEDEEDEYELESSRTDPTVATKMMKEVSRGIIDFYAATALILAQHAKKVFSPQIVPEIEHVKKTLVNVLKETGSSRRHLKELSQSLDKILKNVVDEHSNRISDNEVSS